MPPVRGVVEGEVDNRCVDIIRFPIGLSSLPNIFRASERVSITEFGVCEGFVGQLLSFGRFYIVTARTGIANEGVVFCFVNWCLAQALYQIGGNTRIDVAVRRIEVYIGNAFFIGEALVDRVDEPAAIEADAKA